MTRRFLIVALALATCGGCVVGGGADDLPFYESGDLMPVWSPVEHHVGRFSLVAQTGTPVSDETLRGRIHVASFIYTRCSVMCPVLVRSLQHVQEAVRDAGDVTLVSYTVTPEVDTPETLAAFGRERGIDPARWLLVTGDRGQIYSLARESYFADDGRELEGETLEEAFLHTEKLLLVDQDLRLRGVYNGSSAFDVEKLVEDIAALRQSGSG